ncbi:4-hydroxy-3-methylbut-2-enyl diphosphate reductase [Chitinophaga solisilvae]|uniref:4-hydroxy-3-methylbut-2-enyl diphosphate reductase n=1 Tax=Chitinophaga solisilvae TaxID=1233460 RepID=A0A433WC56_9BACT|nr:4-hydroxy-3-methylbut-2-enyl diphosphate reductase [Chitinophaga solisilvae]NSL88222.1 4-hydroxy-3-methylbut-2-enyl diphosphate reductase [Chitinophaga solisilvae]
MKTFNVPVIYRSPLISAIKNQRKQQDRMKKDFSPTLLDFGPLKILLARHFGFCYGVENAIEIAFRTVEENPGKRIFLLSEMIHNAHVNNDLLDRGVQFIMDTAGKQLIPWEDLQEDDIVIIPAFGTTLEIETRLHSLGIEPLKYNTTCPFVERVWNKAEQIGKKSYTVIVHGKPGHEETRATFSHSRSNTPTVVVKDMAEAEKLAAYINGTTPAESFYTVFKDQYSPGFDVTTDLQRVGVVNQTTMLATETQAIADYIRQVITAHYQLTEATVGERFADTRDTLCYATNDNQSAVTGMLLEPADLAIVVGGYNSSNTSHLVELCEEKLPTYFISAPEHIHSAGEIDHYDFHHKQVIHSDTFLPEKERVTVLLTSGASCPDALVEGVIRRLLSFYGLEHKADEMATAD